MGQPPIRRFRNRSLIVGLRLLRFIGRRLSLRQARFCGATLGRLAALLVVRERRRALMHIGLAMPELSARERRVIVGRMFRHLGISLLEICWLPNLDSANLSRTTTIEGLDHLRDALASGRGVVLFTGHCGNWEWLGAAVTLSGFDLSVIAREIDEPSFNDFIVRARAEHHVRTIGRGSDLSAREMLRALRGGSFLGVLIDQNIRAESAAVPFFGMPAPTPVGPARLAIRSEAVAIACFIERRGGRQYIHFEEPIHTNRSDDPLDLTARMTAAIERQVRRAPEQWVWMHRRWKVRKART